MADEIAVMNNGRIEQLGSATELYERPVTEFVANFPWDLEPHRWRRHRTRRARSRSSAP